MASCFCAVLAPIPPLPDAVGTLAEQFARRVAARHAPPPPLSQEPAAVLARLAAWTQTALGIRSTHSRQRLAQMLVLLMQYPEVPLPHLQAAAGLGERATSRLAHRLRAAQLVTRTQRGPSHYYRLTQAAEDALLLVVAGPPTEPVTSTVAANLPA